MAPFVMDELSRHYTNVEYVPVDISKYADGNCGPSFVWSFDSGRSGPHAMICGIMHGNEIAGAAILDRLIEGNVRPTRGKLTYCFGNPTAYGQFDSSAPYNNRSVDADMNRVWGAEIDDDSNQLAEVRRVRALRPIVDTVDYLLDIHTMQGRGRPVALLQGKPAALDFAKSITGIPLVLTGTMHQAERLRLRDYAQFGDPKSKSVAIQLEAGQHWQASAIDEGEQVALEFLECAGVLPKRPRIQESDQKRLKVVEIILPEGGIFEYAKDFENGAYFPQHGTLLGFAGPDRREVRTPVDECYFIMPVHFRLDGGSCGRFAKEIVD
ncbi:MAG: succinylglutamate desuccinylase [Boseongicola sp.]|nr:MAG: succinylglutamate desuccinylase [Boseongicola sp.]